MHGAEGGEEAVVCDGEGLRPCHEAGAVLGGEEGGDGEGARDVGGVGEGFVGAGGVLGQGLRDGDGGWWEEKRGCWTGCDGVFAVLPEEDLARDVPRAADGFGERPAVLAVVEDAGYSDLKRVLVAVAQYG